MRILFLTQTYPRFDGDPAGPFIRELARGLVRTGDEVTVIVPHARDVAAAWDDDGVTVKSFRYAPERLELLGYSRSLQKDETMKGGALLSAPLYLLGARRAVGSELRLAQRQGRSYDLLQGHWVVPNGLVVSRFSDRVAVAGGIHGSDVFMAEKAAFRPLARHALGRLGAITGCSPELVERVCALGFPADRSQVIPYGIDSALFSPDPSRRNIWRQKLGVPEDAPMIVSVGRMATKKGYQVLLDGLDQLMAADETVHLVLAGAGDRLEEFQRRAASHRDRVHFPGVVYRDTLPDLYRAADIFCLPAVHDPKGNVDGLPNVILEGMASGLPVVATSISGIPLAVEEGKNGRLVPEGDAEQLIAALIDLLSDLGSADRMGQAGREKAVAELSWDCVAGRYREAYGLAVEHRARYV
ncbi:MAG: glycosyltransferase [Thermoanaerobaculia bacterium]|nr:glycosyltransferase [Thermoanaerobaculia bacterium]